ncbi:MAG: response regulator [Lentisphaerota bacterium]
MKDKPIILVVDDQPKNIELLEAYLVPQGYEIIQALNGEKALEKYSGNKIDLVLLDVMMSGMNGYEFCRILKRDANYLPVIMLTSLGDRDSRITGIESGADDFLSKPFDSTELKLKIKNLLKTKFLYDKVGKSFCEIKALCELKDSLTAFIVHDLRNPLSGIKGYLDLLSTSKNLQERDLSDVEQAKQSVKVMISMISRMLDMAKMENNEMAINADDCELAVLVSSAIRGMAPLINEKAIHLSDKINLTNTTVKVQRDLIERVVQNLLSNAIRYTLERGRQCLPFHTAAFRK